MNVVEFLNDLMYLEFSGFKKCLNAYLENDCINEQILDVRFNRYSGYVYIHLHSGLTIASRLGRTPVFFAYDQFSKEIECETYQVAIEVHGK